MLPALLLLCVFSTVNSEFSDNEWRPVTRERVFNLRNFIKTELNANLPQHSEFADTFTDEHFHPKNVVDARKDQTATADKRTLSDSFLNTEIPVTLNTLSRKAKTFNNDANAAIENMINDDQDTKKDLKARRANTAGYENTYSVTEDTDDVTADQTNIDEGYEYAPIKEEAKNSLTDDFLKILSSYNIRSTDKLPNYALSRQNSRHSGIDKFMYIQVPLRVPMGYNSPNHALVDPILAVFLSNYGYYLPGVYGISGNYKNLYGYTAANNIHNNKPFGSYKVYSDTDFYH